MGHGGHVVSYITSAPASKWVSRMLQWVNYIGAAEDGSRCARCTIGGPATGHPGWFEALTSPHRVSTLSYSVQTVSLLFGHRSRHPGSNGGRGFVGQCSIVIGLTVVVRGELPRCPEQ